MRSHIFPVLAGVLMVFSACSRPKPLVVGSKDTTEQKILAEIVAQHLEHHAGIEVRRQFGLGDTQVIYQALISGEIGLYPEYSEIAITDLLREIPSGDSGVIFERARLEMKRIALLEYLAPLGFDRKAVIAISAAGHEGLVTASQAAANGARWSLGITQDAQKRVTGLPALNLYPFEMGAPTRTLKASELFPAMEEGMINLLLTTSSDGHLMSSKWKALEDDKMVFPAAPVALLVRDDVLAADSKIKPALDQLAGKISLQEMRKMNAAVDLNDQFVENVAADFLKSAGLN